MSFLIEFSIFVAIIVFIFLISYVGLYIYKWTHSYKYISKKEFTQLSIDKMFEFAEVDLTHEDIDGHPEYHLNHSMTKEQKRKWREWFIHEYRNNLMDDAQYAIKEYEWINLNFGLPEEDETS